MKRSAVVLGLCGAISAIAAGTYAQDVPGVHLRPQSSESVLHGALVPQGSEDDSTLELGRQPAPDMKPEAGRTPDRSPVQSDERGSSSLGIPTRQQDETLFSRGRPYLGMTVQETIIRTRGPFGNVFGGDEPGMEILTLDPGGPAEAAGLRAIRTGTKDFSTGSVLRRPALLVDELLATGDVYDTGGDVIIAANGKRIATRAELERELKLIGPGDTIELTVIRRTKSWGRCERIKFPIRAGEWKEARK